MASCEALVLFYYKLDTNVSFSSKLYIASVTKKKQREIRRETHCKNNDTYYQHTFLLKI